jgi:hypothetical protein
VKPLGPPPPAGLAWDPCPSPRPSILRLEAESQSFQEWLSVENCMTGTRMNRDRSAVVLVPKEDEGLARLLVDDPASAKAVLGGLRMIFEETEVAVVRLSHRPGELNRAASRLGEQQINIDYSYCGLEPGSARADGLRGRQPYRSRKPAGRACQRRYVISWSHNYCQTMPQAGAKASGKLGPSGHHPTKPMSD